jgi:serine/threonine protein kinase/tetratricopeptide (TPR) repeat protein
MNTDDWSRLEALIEAALAAPTRQRDRLLVERSAGDEALLAEARSLLAQLDADPDFLEPPTATTSDTRAGETQLPTIPGWRLQRRLGAGGMGEVFLATADHEPDGPRVAIKVLRHGLDSTGLLRRFAQERRILSSLDHPGIAQLVDAATTTDGRPCFVLEYVPGVAITAFADLHRLSVDERIRLVIDVCDAVSHAHRSLVVHRDIKPANILVTEERAAKLLDFGIGKIIATDAAPASLETAPSERMLTLDYAAPEQLRDEVVTTATDVHALGILLYELLTGVHPFRREGDTPGQIEQAVLERIPDRPSAVVRSAPSSGPIAASDAKVRAEARAASGPDALGRRLAGDLDNIVLKALRKEPDRRYASVAELAADLTHHLDGRPVMARPDTLGYRAAKFVRRNAGSVLVATLAVIALIVTTATALLESRRATRATAAARAERDEAVAVRSFLMETYGATGAGDQVGASETVRQLVDRQAARIDRNYAERPLLAARLHEVVADAYDRLGIPASAERPARRALELRLQHQGQSHRDVAAAHNLLGWVLHQAGNRDSATVHLRRALELQREREPIDSAALSRALNDLGVLLNATGDWDEAKQVLSEALQIRRRLNGDSSLAVGITANNLAATHYYLKELGDAHRVQALAVAALGASVGTEHQRSVIALGNLAAFRLADGDATAAEADYRRLLALQSRLQGREHPVTLRVMTSLAAALLARQGDTRGEALAEAESIVEEALAIQERQPGQGLPQLVVTLERLAAIRMARGDTARAAPVIRRALDKMVALHGPDHPQVAQYRSRWCSPRTGC